MQVKLTLTVADVVKSFVKDFVKELGIELAERQVNILEMVHLDPSISARAITEKNSGKKFGKKYCDR